MTSQQRRTMLRQTPSYTMREYAIRLNNEGVHQAITGHDKEAVILFSKSLSTFDALVVSKQTQTEESSKRQQISASSATLLATTTRLPNFGDDNDSYLFNKLITFGRSTDSDGSNIPDLWIYCSGIILNMALIYHRQALRMESGDSQDRAINKTERLYQRIIKLAPSGQDLVVDKSTGMGLRLAALHNLGKISTFRHGQCPCAMRERTSKKVTFATEHDVDTIKMEEMIGDRSSPAIVK